MQRIVKRFLLHSQRESDDNHERDFEELKQDLQMIRYEMLNDLKRSKEESYQSVSLIHAGLSIIGEEVFKNSTADNLSRFTEYKSYGNDIKEMYQDEFLDPMDVGDDGDENAQQDPTLHSGKKGRLLRRKFKLINVVNKALQNGDVPVLLQSSSMDENRELEDKKDEEEIMEENRQIISFFRHERHSERSFAERPAASSENNQPDLTNSQEMVIDKDGNRETEFSRNDENEPKGNQNEEESSHLNIEEERSEAREQNADLDAEEKQDQENDQEAGNYTNENVNPSEIEEHQEEFDPDFNLQVEENQAISGETGDSDNYNSNKESATEESVENSTQNDSDENKETKTQNNDSYYFF